MNQSEILKKWQTNSSTDPVFTGELKNMLLTSNKFSKNFESSLKMKSGVIRSKIGVGTSVLNEYTSSSVAYNLSIFLHKSKLKNVLVTHDGTFHGILYSKVFASTLIDENINAYFYYENQPLNNATSIWIAQKSKIKFDAIVTFSQFNTNSIYEISFFKINGSLFNDSESKEIGDYIWSTNYLNIEISKTLVPQIQENLNEKYIDYLSTNCNIDNVSLFVSNTHNFNQNLLDAFLKKNGIEYKVDYYKKNPNNNSTITRKSFLKTFCKKFDVIVNFLTNNNSFEFVIKHKQRKKILTINDLSIIYLYYRNLIDENKQSNSKKIVITDYKTSKFINYYAKQNKFKTINSLSLENEIENLSNEKVFLLTNGEKYFVTEHNESYANDPLLNLKIFLEMVSYFKHQNKTLYDILVEIHQTTKMYRFNKTEERISSDKVNLLFYRIQNLEKIDNNRIIRRKNLFDDKKTIEILLEDQTSIIFEYNEKQSLLKTYYSIWENNLNDENLNIEQKYINLIIKQKNIVAFINDLKTTYESKKFTWKGFVKYFCLLVLFCLFFWFIFQFIFGADKQLFNQIGQFLRNNQIIAYALPVFIFAAILDISFSCWFNARILKKMNEKFKFRHLVTANIIGICISTITPMVFGGESVGYWYLRRRGLRRHSIISLFLIQSLLFQINIVLCSIIFIPIGFSTFFPSLISNLDSNSIALIIMMFVGFFFDIFSVTMLLILTFNSRFQKFIVRTLNKFFEWLPFVVSKDSAARGANIQYEFSNINKASRDLFSSESKLKGTLFFFELLFYRFLIRVYDSGAIFAIVSGFIKPGYFAGGYFNIISGQTLIRCVDALNFITPSGLGVSDWAKNIIMNPIFKDEANVSQGSEYLSINVYQTLERILYTISWAIISALLLFTILVGERRIDKYNNIKKTLTENEISLGNIKTKTTFYKQSIGYWTFGIIAFVTTWVVVLKYVIIPA